MFIFIVLQLINVVISTFKSVLTIRGTKITAATINAIAYSINVVIIYLVAQNIELIYSIIITSSTNLIGVYVGLSILDRFRKDQLWRIQTTVPTKNISGYKRELLNNNIKFISYETTWEEFKVVDIFSRTRKESKIIREIIYNYGGKYTISSNSNYL